MRFARPTRASVAGIVVERPALSSRPPLSMSQVTTFAQRFRNRGRGRLQYAGVRPDAHGACALPHRGNPPQSWRSDDGAGGRPVTSGRRRMAAEHSRTLRHRLDHRLESRWVRAAVTLVAGALPALAFPAPVPVVVRLCRAGAVDAAGALRAHRSPGGAGRLARRHRVHAGRAPLAAAEPACLHRSCSPRCSGCCGRRGAWLVRRLLAGTARARAGSRPLLVAGAVGLADGRTGPLLGGLGRPLGSARREPVAGHAGAAAGVGGRGVAGQPSCWSP